MNMDDDLSPTNRRQLAQFEARLADLFRHGLRRGFGGRLAVAAQIQDGTIQRIDPRMEQDHGFEPSARGSPAPDNTRKLAQLKAGNQRFLRQGLRRGFYGNVIVVLPIEDGVIQNIHRKVEENER